MLPGFAFAILRPEMQTPGLVIRKHADNGVDDAVGPRIDRRGLYLNGIGKCLPGKREQQSFQLYIRSNADVFDLALRRIRRCATEFIGEECPTVRIG